MKTLTSLPQIDTCGPRRPAIRVDRGDFARAAQRPYLDRLEDAFERAFSLAFTITARRGGA